MGLGGRGQKDPSVAFNLHLRRRPAHMWPGSVHQESSGGSEPTC